MSTGSGHANQCCFHKNFTTAVSVSVTFWPTECHWLADEGHIQWHSHTGHASMPFVTSGKFSLITVTAILTRHRASTSMYSLTFRVCVTTPPQYGRNRMAHAAGTSILLPARRVFAGMRSVWCGMRAVGLADYRWALPRISIVLP